MESIYDALYNYAQNRQDLTRWLHDEDIVKDYQECLEYSTRQEKQLMEALDDPARKQFEIYIGNVQGVRAWPWGWSWACGPAIKLPVRRGPVKRPHDRTAAMERQR